MKAEDIINQLALTLPANSTLFTDNFSVTSLTLSGSTMTVTTDDINNLAVTNAVFIAGAENPIVISSFTRVGTVGFIVTAEDHDYTFGDATTNVDTEGANESEFNGSFVIGAVPNRRNIQVIMANTGATTATGSPIATNASSALSQFNGLFAITVIVSPTVFEVETSATSLAAAATGTITARANPRISGLINLERLIDVYTEQVPTELWLFVTLGPVVASKNRQVLSDAVDNTSRQAYLRQQLIQNVSIYVVIPTASQEIAARSARDLAEDVFEQINNSILFFRFNTGLFDANTNALQFVSHDNVLYNTAFYIHEYNYELVANLQFEDSVGYDEDVAFRNINLNMNLDIGTGENTITTTIDLDEEQL